MADVEDVLKHVPRAYQEEIFEQARRGNIIAALETGSGKTFIAALLIKWVMAQPSQAGRKAVFLVPKVPLVDQQCDFLAEQTPLAIRGYKGAMGLDAWDKGRWALEFAQSDCLVMTAQIFKNILVHGYWSMDRTSLLVFDECHHAQRNHPYNMIMTDHYWQSKTKPKVFGMTASPIWNPKKPLASIRALQTNLSSKVLAVRLHTESLGQHMNRPTEIILRFSSLVDGQYASYYKPSLWEKLESAELLNIPRLRVKTLRLRYEVTLGAVGPAGADYFLLSLLSHASNVMEERANKPHAAAPSVTKPSSSHAEDVFSESERQDNEKSFAGRRKELREALSAFQRRLVSDVRALPSEWLSPKLQAAVDILIKHRSDTFQGIIFVDQRQVVAALSWILCRVAETKDWIRCGELTGHGEVTKDGERIKGMDTKEQRDVVQSFKAGKLNLLIATAVGEEGLDFPACQLVIRYDSVQHMVGYVQSRGRARQQNSTYVIMAEENDAANIARYEGFRQAEPILKTVYQSMNAPGDPSSESGNGEDLEDGEDDPLDIASREKYTIPCTGATLTYSSAISLLNHLCALIPRDMYTPSLQPRYTGDFKATVHLPQALPLSRDQLTFEGPLKRSKREAKRAVAFLAVRTLHMLAVFDDHLSPIKSQKGESIEDADGRPIAKVSAVATMMDVLVVSPWKAGPPWYLHVIYIEDHVHAGLVCGSSLPDVVLTAQGRRIQVQLRSSTLPFDITLAQVELMDRFTKMGIWWCITGSPVISPSGCFLVPLSPFEAVDWPMMEKAVSDEKGTYDWSEVTENDEGKLMLMNSRKMGHPLRLVRLRYDLSLDSKPSVESTEESFDTYADYFESKYPLHFKSAELSAALKPPVGRIIEVSAMSRYPSASYGLPNSGTQGTVGGARQPASTFLLPESYCRRAMLHTEIIHAFQVFAPICQRLCDVFRARVARRFLKYPAIPDDLMIEALTLPCAGAGFNNQRLETMGDSVLKLSVVVYIFNSFPNKHEGQLDALKSNSVSNRLLLARAKEAQLERFLSSERRNMRAWQFVQPSVSKSGKCSVDSDEIALVRRLFPRRSLQDCMEASLGAAYVTGGINLALQAGTALGLCFGGCIPWPERYLVSERIPPAALFSKLQEDLRYTFRNGNLLVEAVKHPSFDSHEGGSCYQRLEFLGDAVVELVVTTYLYNKFPGAKSGQLTWARARAICNATLAALAVKRLSLHKYILANNADLSKDIGREVAALSVTSYQDVTVNDWKYDPPKALADVFESVIGAIFVDSAFNYATVAPILERVMEDVLSLLHPDMPRNPVTRLLEWTAKAGCSKAKFKRVQSNPLINKKDSVVVQVHGSIVAGPILAANKPLAKGLVAEAAMNALSDESSEFALSKICECMHIEDEEEASDLPERNVREKDINVETTEGFALAGRIRLGELEQEDQAEVDELSDEELEEIEQQEVELLLCTPSSLASEVDDMDCT